MKQQKSSGRPAGRKNTAIRADRMEVIQQVAEKLITGMSTASSSELAQAIWPETAQDKTTLNAKSKSVRLALQNITANPELAAVSQEALHATLTERAAQKKSPEDIEKEKAAREALRLLRVEEQKKDWLSQPIRLMESRIKAMVKESLGVYIGEGVSQSAPLPNNDVQVAGNTFTRESVLRVLELELKIQIHTALRYTWNGEEAWEFYQKAKELIRVKKKLCKATGLTREETQALSREKNELRDQVELAFERMNEKRGWADPDLYAAQHLADNDLKSRVIQHHTVKVESWAAEKLPADVIIEKDDMYPEADNPWEEDALEKPDNLTYAMMKEKQVEGIKIIDEPTVDFEVASIISKRLLQVAGLQKEKAPDESEGLRKISGTL